ncbi:Putative ribonuclease H protein At1g65750 [Linum perenne]
MDKKLAGWKVKNLSLAGRVTFAQSVLAAIPAYAMQTSVLPANTCEEIDKRIRSFVWGTTAEERKISLVAWDKIYLPKEKGGLGIKSARLLNRAYLTKLAFLFLKDKDRLWVRIIQHKYFSEGLDGLVVRNLKSKSPLWRGISKEWGTMLEGAKSAIRDGRETFFWSSCWVDAGLRLADFADSSKPEFDATCSVAEMVTDEGGWNFELLDILLPPEVIELIAGVSPPRHDRGEDDLVWGLEDSGQFTIKSAYNLLCQSADIPSLSIWKVIWRWVGPNRTRHFLWLAAKNRLLTNESRSRQGLCQEAKCEFCGDNNESVSHVLRDCSFARETWRLMCPGDIEKPEWQLHVVDWMEFFLKAECSLQFGVVCWALWKARNERLFANGRDKPEVVGIKASKWIHSIQDAMCREEGLEAPNERRRRIEVSWKAGPQGWATLNSDGSVRTPHGQASAGGLIRDSSSNCLQAFTVNLGRCSITRAEICGALEGVRRAWDTGYRKLEVQMDSKKAMSILLNFEPASSHQFTLEVMEFQEWLQREWEVKVIHVYREANKAADYLANLGHNTTRGVHTVDISDCNLAYFVRHDCLGISEPRVIK